MKPILLVATLTTFSVSVCARELQSIQVESFRHMGLSHVFVTVKGQAGANPTEGLTRVTCVVFDHSSKSLGTGSDLFLQLKANETGYLEVAVPVDDPSAVKRAQCRE